MLASLEGSVVDTLEAVDSWLDAVPSWERDEGRRPAPLVPARRLGMPPPAR